MRKPKAKTESLPNLSKKRGFKHAIYNGNVQIVKLLVYGYNIDPSIDYNTAIIIASEYGYYDIVQLLLSDKRVDPTDQNNEAIIIASNYGHTEIVRLLLVHPCVDPHARKSSALTFAKKNGYEEIVDILENDYRMSKNIVTNNSEVKYIFT